MRLLYVHERLGSLGGAEAHVHDDGSVNRLLLRQIWTLALTTPADPHV